MTWAPRRTLSVIVSLAVLSALAALPLAVADLTTTTPNLVDSPPIPAVLTRRPAGMYASSLCRKGKILDVVPWQVISPVQSAMHCLKACFARGPRCKAFNYGNKTCSLLETVLCKIRGPRGYVQLKEAPGFSYYDLFDRDGIRGTGGKLPHCVTESDDSDSSDVPPDVPSDATIPMTPVTNAVTTASDKNTAAGHTTQVPLGSYPSGTSSGTTSGTTAGTPSSTTSKTTPRTTSRTTSSVASGTSAEQVFYIKRDPKPFDEAEKICLSEGASLAAPRTLDDHRALLSLMRKVSVRRLWIGIRRTPNDETVYLNGDLVPAGSQHWALGQPNNSGGIQTCVEMRESLDHLWNDFDCESPAPFACQRKTTGSRSTSAVSGSDQ